MANPEHLKIFNEGVGQWNAWRKENNKVAPDLSNARLLKGNYQGANLSGTNLSGAILNLAGLEGADLSKATLSFSFLTQANLAGARLYGANLQSAVLRSTNLAGADLSGADMAAADFTAANLTDANLWYSSVVDTKFSKTNLLRADFTMSSIGNSSFNDLDLSKAIGLDLAEHFYPSSIGLDTLYKSQGKIPEAFLRGCGMPEDFIAYVPSLVGAVRPIQYCSCFISYSTLDEDFARRLHSRMQEAKLRVWFAPADMKGGKKIYDQIDNAIQVHDKLLLVLSESSIKSEWVLTEIRKALRTEKKENRRKLFPIRLVSYEKLKAWELFDADSGRDLAVEIRSYFIPDFSRWKDHDAFEAAFDRLLSDLKADEGKEVKG